jgi:hypothetical protein
MATKNRTIEAITSGGTDEGLELPEWARPDQAPESEEAPTEAPARSVTPALDNLLEWLVAEADAMKDDELALGMEAIVRQVLSATDMAQVLRKTMPISGGDVVGVPMLLGDFTIRESEFEGSKSLPYYASLQVMMGDPPEPRVINVGSIKVLAQLKRMRELGQWPVVVMVEEARAAKKGESAPLTLTEVPQPA